MDAIDDLKRIVNADDVSVEIVSVEIEKLRAIHTVFPDEANFLCGVIWGLYTQLGYSGVADKIFHCLDEA